ncbi:methyl-accepting chemotaxis protein [Halanaeroarchaeum sulfurireducens]|uniref:Methyl-accepting chemotaxis sensory transducer with Pas/Pac sensor n=1 Tax=Halanaeroarchaeum sulfurireducens TaxID=1604004 RepID=A0A0F7PCY4_9EURY|nr:methyl-accepting chemotaxis protein [Halanaeroarchaeum sulfurireducens]AKH97168.1 methyl-accepting chemotaxis sensory transducer with Pas/Pac sensor [Halanaeroarchaeum sulfurireducens]ALG81569.1 methyl-accepting chemotaxis sensory transducer with Pas/Pac sensor [Halanaeroarchaeum sulfurireducens]
MIHRLKRLLFGQGQTDGDDQATQTRSNESPDVARSDGGQVQQPTMMEAGDADVTAADDDDAPPDRVDEGFPLGFRAILGRIGTPIFVLDADGDVVHWNEALAELTGDTEAEAKANDQASESFYHDGRRAQTLADKVLEAPENADEEFGVPRVVELDYTLYRDTSTMLDAHGEERHISFSASPLYRDGELVGVVEMVQDRTEEVLRNQGIIALVEEVEATMKQMKNGNLGARATFQGDENIDADLAGVVAELNKMGEQLQTLVGDVSNRTGELHDATESVAESAREIDRLANEQSESTAEVAGEVSNLSATIEEVASSADNVAETSQRARNRAEDGRELAGEIGSVMEEVSEASTSVRSDFDTLRTTVEQIDEVIEVIDDIADQTNLLALNANIEAARADEGGDGFAVVANEIKDLAEESKTQAGEIESLIDEVQTGTEQTVESLEETETRIESGVEEVDAAMETLDEIADAVEEAVEGIEEVSDVTDDQAASAEEIAAMVDGAQEKAQTVSEEVSEVAAATEEQTQQVADIDESIEELAEGSGGHQ